MSKQGAERAAPCGLSSHRRRSASRWLAVVLETAPIALGLGKGQHLGHEGETRQLVHDVAQPIEASSVEPAGPLLPQERVASIVDQLLYEVRVWTRDCDRGYRQTPGALADQVDVRDGLELVRRAAEPLRLGVAVNELLVTDDRD